MADVLSQQVTLQYLPGVNNLSPPINYPVPQVTLGGVTKFTFQGLSVVNGAPQTFSLGNFATVQYVYMINGDLVNPVQLTFTPVGGSATSVSVAAGGQFGGMFTLAASSNLVITQTTTGQTSSVTLLVSGI